MSYWFIEENKGHSKYHGVGFAKINRRCQLDEYKKLPLDSHGKPKCTPDEVQPILHQEHGYIIVYRDEDYKHPRIVKMMSLPKGQTILVKGEYDEHKNSCSFNGVDTDEDFYDKESHIGSSDDYN